MQRVTAVLAVLAALAVAGSGTWLEPAKTQPSTFTAGFRAAASSNNPDIPKTTRPMPTAVPNILSAPQSLAEHTAPVSSARFRLSKAEIEIVPGSMTDGGSFAEDSLYYDGDPMWVIQESPVWYCAVRFTPAMSCTVKAVKFYEYQAVVGSGQVQVYDQGDPVNPGTLLSSQTFTAGTPGWRRVDLPAPGVYVPAGRDFWTCVFGNVADPPGYSPLTTDDGTNYADGREFLSVDGSTWWKTGDIGIAYNWNERAIIVPLPYDNDMQGLALGGVTSPVCPNQWLTLDLTVKNIGNVSRPAGVPVRLSISGPSAYSYTDNEVTATVLNYGETEQVVFAPSWRVPATTGTYTIKAWTDLTGDQNRANDTVRYTLEVSNWITYADWNNPYWVTWADPERGQMYYPDDFGAAYPVKLESLKTEFGWHSSYPWTDSTFRYKVYDSDLQTLLYTSPWLEALPTVHRFFIPTLEQPTVTEGMFAVTVEPWPTTQVPLTRGDNVHDQRSFFGDPAGGWYWWDSGELFIASYVSWTAPANDIGFVDLTAPYLYVEPGVPVTPRGTVRNYGTNNQTAAACSCFVVDTTTDARVWSGYATVTVNAGATAPVAFPAWTPPAGNNVYEVAMVTFLATEQNPSNDDIYHVFMGFDVVEELQAPFREVAVTLDGLIDPDEWADANRYDISNILGWNDIYRYFPGNAFLSVKHDSDYVYMAVDIPFVAEDETTEIGLYFDENNDGAWAGDETEGNYWVENWPDTAIYRSLPAAVRYHATGLLHEAGNTSGNLQFEFAVPYGSAKEQLTMNPHADTCGLWAFALNDEYGNWLGWWQTTMSDEDPINPANYSRLVLLPPPPPGPVWPSGWIEMTKHVPGATPVKDGGWLVTATPDDGQPLVYAAKGNKSTEFYSYDPIADTWSTLAPIHADEGGRDKPPKKGCAATTDGVENIYMTKGANTPGFWKYSISTNTWTRLPDVPLGPDGKKVKGGNDLAYVQDGDTGFVYLMKGYKTEFYRFNTVTSKWDSTLQAMPFVVAGKYGGGSFLVYDNEGALYAHQAKYTDPAKTAHYMFKYDLASQAWITPATPKGMPVLGKDGGKMKNKKSKDGGSGAWYDGSIYALKGGNTVQFYRYDAADTAWTELDTLKSFGSTAKKKKVKNGGDLTSYGNDAFFAMKGNKTVEFWRYVIPTPAAGAAGRSGVMAGFGDGQPMLAVGPNPLVNGSAVLRYVVPRPGVARVTVFDVGGRTVAEQAVAAARSGSLSLDLRKLAGGVYLVRFDADGWSATRKLVVER